MSTSYIPPCEPSLSIILPTWNGASFLRELLGRLSRQTLSFLELLVVDSSSTDQTVAIAGEFGAEVVIIPQEKFDHGGTRTMLARRASADILVFLTQDALPVTDDALEKLIYPLLSDPTIAVTYGRQLPDSGATVFAAHLRSFNYPPQSIVRSFSDRQEFGLQTAFASNSFAAYRKTSLADVGYFRGGLIFGEDTCAVGLLLMKGYKVAYVAEAMVYHSHNYTCLQEFRRSFDIGVLHGTEKWLLETYGRAEGRGWLYIRSGVSYLLGSGQQPLLPAFFWRVLLKFFGYKLGRLFRLLPLRLIPLLSMHRSWWTKNTGLSA